MGEGGGVVTVWQVWQEDLGGLGAEALGGTDIWVLGVRVRYGGAYRQTFPTRVMPGDGREGGGGGGGGAANGIAGTNSQKPLFITQKYSPYGLLFSKYTRALTGENSGDRRENQVLALLKDVRC